MYTCCRNREYNCCSLLTNPVKGRLNGPKPLSQPNHCQDYGGLAAYPLPEERCHLTQEVYTTVVNSSPEDSGFAVVLGPGIKQESHLKGEKVRKVGGAETTSSSVTKRSDSRFSPTGGDLHCL